MGVPWSPVQSTRTVPLPPASGLLPPLVSGTGLVQARYIPCTVLYGTGKGSVQDRYRIGTGSVQARYGIFTMRKGMEGSRGYGTEGVRYGGGTVRRGYGTEGTEVLSFLPGFFTMRVLFDLCSTYALPMLYLCSTYAQYPPGRCSSAVVRFW